MEKIKHVIYTDQNFYVFNVFVQRADQQLQGFLTASDNQRFENHRTRVKT